MTEGTNQVTSTQDPTAHAEVIAIREACRKLSVFQLLGCEIYTSCEPWPMCLGAIYWAHLSRIYFATHATDASTVGFDDLLSYLPITPPRSTRRIPMHPTLREPAL